jgi:hypothetical protein
MSGSMGFKLLQALRSFVANSMMTMTARFDSKHSICVVPM